MSLDDWCKALDFGSSDDVVHDGKLVSLPWT